MIILSIRGTSEVGDMAIDMKMWMKEFEAESPKAKVHAGYFQLLKKFNCLLNFRVLPAVYGTQGASEQIY
jgi:hypothetical protein